MAKYRLTNKAVEDLAKIWEYTFEQWSEQQADNYYKLLISNCQEIAKNPTIGKNYEGIISNLLGLKTNKHIIFYRINLKNEIEITRILHGRMDLKNQILE
ncbi:MAG: type II toxin-antitoxin system RelE/ParE family toxin [Bacteroidetes bacterium]|nr:type II toxin-antitoxin system RelE/ParE family toxin [Bacteroidota bacterium]